MTQVQKAKVKDKLSSPKHFPEGTIAVDAVNHKGIPYVQYLYPEHRDYGYLLPHQLAIVANGKWIVKA